MRLRATPKALALRLDGGETPEEIQNLKLPEGLPLDVEVAGPVPAPVLEALLGLDRPLALVPPRNRTSAGALVLSKTLRSGERVEHPGTVVVLGDVNPGAEVVAGGDVIVVGKLRGLAHAGASGDEERFVFALELAAKQLRIGTHLAQAPEGKGGHGPEIARVLEGQIVVEPARKRWYPPPPHSASVPSR